MKIKQRICLLLFAFFTCHIHAQYEANSPEWAKDIIIYELSPKSFTSPEGAETGTFTSTKERIPYLHDLGINAVWLTGHSWSDPKHFYNIWTQYACIQPDSLDYTLGTAAEFKSMVDEFHKYGIKVFLDIITHGVMKCSPLVLEKPHWFKGESWGMADYDWYGNHKDLDDWWVEFHTRYVTDYSIDGFRLDVAIYRPDLWHKVKNNAEKAGRPITIFAEHDFYTDNVSDFYQTVSKLGVNRRENTKEVTDGLELLHNVASYYKKFVDSKQQFSIKKVNVTYMDDSEDFVDPINKKGKLSFSTERNGQSRMKIHIKNIDNTKSIKNITITPVLSASEDRFIIESSDIHRKHVLSISGLSEISLDFIPLSFDKAYLTSELSSHDRGWDSFPLGMNPYLAQGSRCIFGYSCLFTPAIPIIMAGEEFDANFIPLPTLSPSLYKKEKIGEGRWLYGSWIHWDQLKQKRHQDMYADVKKNDGNT